MKRAAILIALVGFGSPAIASDPIGDAIKQMQQTQSITIPIPRELIESYARACVQFQATLDHVAASRVTTWGVTEPTEVDRQIRNLQESVQQFCPR